MSDGVVIAIITVIGGIAAAIITAVLSQRKPTPPPHVHVSLADRDKAATPPASDRQDRPSSAEVKRDAPVAEPTTPELVISKSGKGSYQSLTQALASIEEGATLKIKPGVYAETTEIGISFELVGDGDPARIVLAAKNGSFKGTGGSVFRQKKHVAELQTVIRGVTLRGTAHYTIEWEEGELVVFARLLERFSFWTRDGIKIDAEATRTAAE